MVRVEGWLDVVRLEECGNCLMMRLMFVRMMMSEMVVMRMAGG